MLTVMMHKLGRRDNELVAMDVVITNFMVGDTVVGLQSSEGEHWGDFSPAPKESVEIMDHTCVRSQAKVEFWWCCTDRRGTQANRRVHKLRADRPAPPERA